MEGTPPKVSDSSRAVRKHGGVCRKETAHKQSECMERQPLSIDSKKRKPFVMQKHYRSSNLIQKYLNSIPLKSEDLYLRILHHKMSKSLMQEYGYPIPDKVTPGKVTLFSNSIFAKPNNPSVQICRCGKQISLLDANWYADDAGCNYHLGKRVYCDGPKNGHFSCCSAHGPPCVHAANHVSFHRPFHDIEFVRVSPEARGRRHPANVYALDCEMAFTTRGMELVRVSLVGIGGVVIYDTYVRPKHPILDYNTPFSGVREEDLSDITTTLSDVHDTLLSILNSDSILIGHSLENDFLALNLVHQNVVDTSFLFPHERGYPFKNSLKHLAAIHLGKSIQEAFRGHDSVEDATTCMELLLYKIYIDTLTPPVLVMSPPPQLYMAQPLVILDGQWMAMGNNGSPPILNVAGSNGKATAQNSTSSNGKATAQNSISSNGKATAQNSTSNNGQVAAQNSTSNNGKVAAQKAICSNGKTSSQNASSNDGNVTSQNSPSEVLNGDAKKGVSDDGNATATAENSPSDAGNAKSQNAITPNGKGTTKIAASNYKDAASKTVSKNQSVKEAGNNPSMVVQSNNKEVVTKSPTYDAIAVSKSEWKVAVKDDASNPRSTTPKNSNDVALKSPWVILPVNKGNVAIKNAPNNGFKRIITVPPPRPYFGAFKNPCPPTFFNGPICPPVLPFFSAGFFVPNNLIRWC